MSGYAICLGACCACGRVMQFNPVLVPSLRVDGEKRPVCRRCVEKWKSMHPDVHFEIPEGAYEPVEEGELP